MIKIKNTAPIITAEAILLVTLPKLKRPRINRPVYK
jgi:hypothetical protein